MSCCASSKGMLVVARARALFRVNDTALALVRIKRTKGGDTGGELKLGSDTASDRQGAWAGSGCTLLLLIIL